MSTPAAKPSSHRWSFYRAGGVDQVRLDKGADILNLDQLDQKLWVALSCPVKGLEIDQRTLELLDIDKDAHVRPPEILAAVKWLRDVLQNADGLVKGEDGVQLANLRKDTAEGKALLASAQHILKSLGKEATVITVADTEKTADVFAKAKRNGDGVVPPDTVDDEKARARRDRDRRLPRRRHADRSGKPATTRPSSTRSSPPAPTSTPGTSRPKPTPRPCCRSATATGAAYAAFQAVRAKIDDYFGRCRLAAFDPRALAAVNREQEAYMAVAAKDLTITASEVAHFPLAIVEANKPLPLSKGVNPAWAGPMARSAPPAARTRSADRSRLDGAVREARRPRRVARQEGRRRGRKLGSQACARDPRRQGSKAALQKAIADDLAVAVEVDAMTRVEKLTRLHRDFARLLNNYVSFTDFYARRGAIFQAGTLYLDGRACDLTASTSTTAASTADGADVEDLPRLRRLHAAGRRRCRSHARSPPATATTCSSAATASSTTARAATGTRRSPRSSTTRSASAGVLVALQEGDALDRGGDRQEARPTPTAPRPRSSRPGPPPRRSRRGRAPRRRSRSSKSARSPRWASPSAASPAASSPPC
jgi:hypothetical protein